MACSFTKDVSDIELKEVREWLDNNCENLGIAVEGLVDEKVGNRYEEQMSPSGDPSYAGQLEWQTTSGAVAADNPEFKSLFSKAGKYVIDDLALVAQAASGPAPSALSVAATLGGVVDPSAGIKGLPATNWGLTPSRDVLDKLIEVKGFLTTDSDMARVLVRASEISGIINIAVETVDNMKIFTDRLVQAVGGATLVSAGGVIALSAAADGIKDMHKATSGASSLAGILLNLASIKADLTILKGHSDTLMDMKKEYDELFQKHVDAADAEIAKLERTMPRDTLSRRAQLKKIGEQRMLKRKWEGRLTSLQFKFTATAGTIAAPSQVARAVPRTYKEQCLLLANVFKLAHYKINYMESIRPKKLPYTASPPAPKSPPSTSKAELSNACLMAQRDPWGFMNQLVQDPSYDSLLNIPTEYLSQLAPMIRLYKIESAPGTTGTKEIQVPITFDSYHNSADELQNILKNNDKRGAGVGLKSFTFSYEGSNPFAVKKSIKAKLVIFASSFDDLLVSRGDFRYADLALKTGGNLQDFLDRTNQTTDSLVANITKLNFRLKAVIGWQLPTGRWEAGKKAPTDVKNAGTALQKAVYNSFVTLNLTPTIHEFDIDELGRVVFTINYLAYIEDFFDQPNFNIFTSSKNEMAALKRKIQISAWEEGCSNDEAIKLKENLQEKIEEEKQSNLNTILGGLLQGNKMFFVPIPRSELAEFTRKGPFYPFEMSMGDPKAFADVSQKDKLKKDFKAAIAQTAAAFKNSKDLTQTPISDMANTEYVSFFYLSDLIDTVLENIKVSLQELAKGVGSIPPPEGIDTESIKWDDIIKSEQERLNRLLFNFEHFRVLLGPIELYDYKTGAGKSVGDPYGAVNLGDLAISVSYFMDWLTDKVLKKDRTIYTLSVFLNDLLNGLVRNFLNNDSCFDLNIKQKTRVFQSVVTSYSPPRQGSAPIDEITWLIRQSRANTAKGMPFMSRLMMNEISALVPSKKENIPILNVMGVRDVPIPERRDPSLEFNYLTYYAGRTQPTEHMLGKADLDRNHGIFHYMIGKPAGLVKTIQLIKTDSPGLKEVRFEQEGYDGLSQLREVYDATITCYGSPNIVPGTYIYIDPKGFSPKNHGGIAAYKNQNGDVIDPFLLTRYGIGGYYMVIRAENKLASGEFNTTITAKWVAEVSKDTPTKKASPRPTKCRLGSFS